MNPLQNIFTERIKYLTKELAEELYRNPYIFGSRDKYDWVYLDEQIEHGLKITRLQNQINVLQDLINRVDSWNVNETEFFIMIDAFQ